MPSDKYCVSEVKVQRANGIFVVVKASCYGVLGGCLLWGLFAVSFAAQPASSAEDWLPGRAVMLHISDGQGRVLQRIPLCSRGCFGIRYTHSVALSPVEDWFYAKGGTIFLDKTSYQDFGAGLPHSPEAGQRMQVGGGMVSISGYDRALPELVLRVGRVARHMLVLPHCCHPDAGPVWRDNTEEMPLSRLIRPGSVLVMSLGSVSFRHWP